MLKEIPVGRLVCRRDKLFSLRFFRDLSRVIDGKAWNSATVWHLLIFFNQLFCLFICDTNIFPFGNSYIAGIDIFVVILHKLILKQKLLYNTELDQASTVRAFSVVLLGYAPSSQYFLPFTAVRWIWARLLGKTHCFPCPCSQSGLERDDSRGDIHVIPENIATANSEKSWFQTFMVRFGQ